MGGSRDVYTNVLVSVHSIFKFFSQLPTFLNWEISHENQTWHYQVTLPTGLPLVGHWIADTFFRWGRCPPEIYSPLSAALRPLLSFPASLFQVFACTTR